MADTGNDPTVIGADIHIKGEMTFQKPVRLVGTFEGSITGQGELQVAKGAACKANVTSSSITVDGIVEGNLVAAEKVQLNTSGVVRGDIVAGKMIMAEGASFFGQCSVGPEAVKAAGGKPAQPGAPAKDEARPAPQQQAGKPAGAK
ncbi:MAG: polymer-forming cytoskeletal protein [Planctomycetes bacterium]|nr:polymer-forming cytoskeletal protein [Planctomycetota bacterium]